MAGQGAYGEGRFVSRGFFVRLGDEVVGYVSLSQPILLMDKSFLLLFCKKEVLPC